jgi:hypothetical protein
MKLRILFSWFVGIALVALAVPALGQASGSVSSVALQGQNKGDTNTWSGGNLAGWQELDMIPCRVLFAGSGNNQSITVYFPHLNGTTPGFENLYNFITSSNVSFVSPPVLSTPASGTWSYTFVVNVTSGGSVNFFARLAAGSHLNVGSSLALSGDPQSMGNLQIHKPAPGAGAPDLAVVKTGPAMAPQGGTITYVLTYTNKATGTNIANTGIGVQISDILPPGVTIDTNTLPPGAQYAGNTIFFDLPDLGPGANGRIIFPAGVPISTPVGTVLTNFAQILSSQNDANLSDNTSTWLTTVTNGCTGPFVSMPPGSQAACPGDNPSFMVIATGTGLTYQWYKGVNLIPGQTRSTLTLTNVTSADAGTYRVITSDACGNSATNSATLTINSVTVVSTFSGDSTNCPGTTANFSVNATGTDLTYQWYFGPNPISGQTGSMLTITNVSAANAGTYSVVVTGACGAAITNSAMLVVSANTLVNTQPVNSTNCPGTTADFNVNATGTDLTYQWYFGPNPIPGQTGSTLTITNVSAANAGTYRVVVAGACGAAITNSAMLVINANTLVNTQPVNSTNCPGTTANFNVNATGTDLTYQWYFGPNPISGQTGSTLSITNVSAANAGTYSVVVTGACGSAITNSAMLVVNANTLVNTQPANSTNCPGTTANFSVTATGTDLTYLWFKGTALFLSTNSSISITNVTAANAGTYTVVVAGACGVPITNSAVLVVNADTLVTMAPSNSTNCPGTTASFSVNATGTDLTYQWYAGTNLLANQTNSMLTLTNVSSADAGTYNVTITGACGSTITNSAVLTVLTNLSIVTPPADQTVCPGGTANFGVNAIGTDLAYQWYNAAGPMNGQTGSTLTLTNVTAAQAGIYNVVVTGACGISQTNSATLFVNADVMIVTPPVNSTNCPGTTANFSINATGTGLTYQWYQGLNPLQGQIANTLTITNVSAANAGTYSVIVTGACGEPVTRSAMLVVNANTLVTIPPANSTNCPGTTASFSVTATGTALTYQWYHGPNPIAGQIANTLTITNVSAATAGIYSVVVTGACGDPVTNNAALVVNANTLVTIPPVNSTNCPGTTANFSVTATGTDLTYLWFKGPALFLGTNSSITIADVTAESAGTYTVVVTGACGTPITNSAVLVVNSDTLVTVPPSNSTNCPGTTANFSVNATGTALTYQWYAGTNLLANQTNSTLTLSNVSPADAGCYNVVVVGACDTATSNKALLVVNQNVSVAPLANVTNNVGSSVTFTAVASGTGPFTYQWYKGANPIPGQTNATLTLSNLQPGDSGAYSVTVTGACGTAVTTGAVLTVNLPPIVNICYPTNGQVFVAPATFNVMASASDPDGTVTNVQFFSSTNGVDFVFLGETNNTPYLTIASNLPAGNYTFVAVATDNLGATGQSTPVTVQVVSPQAPTVTVLGNLTLNYQDGYQWLSNVVCNPVESYAAAVRVYIHNITNNAIQVVNASGVTNGVPYIQSPAAIEPGTCWTNVIKFYDPIQVAFRPILTVELVPVPNAAGNPAGTLVPMLPAKMLANGTFRVEFASINGKTYYVQYSSDMVNWNTAFPGIMGSGQHMQWIDSGPPGTASLPVASVARFYRVIVAQ